MLKKEELDKIESLGAFCELKITYINGVRLDHKDFGEQYDICPDCAEPYGCGNMQFIPYDIISDKILKKYNITQEEAKMIQEKLDCLSFGSCGWCV